MLTTCARRRAPLPHALRHSTYCRAFIRNLPLLSFPVRAGAGAGAGAGAALPMRRRFNGLQLALQRRCFACFAGCKHAFLPLVYSQYSSWVRKRHRQVKPVGKPAMPPIPPQAQSAGAESTTLPRIVMYQQTHFHNGEYVSMLPLLEEQTAVTHVIIAAIHINEQPDALTLNDDPYNVERNDFLWQEVMILQSAGIKVLGMLGGAAKGSYWRLDKDLASFFQYYEPLREMIETTGLNGLDLDVEEDMSLAGIIRLIDQLKSDFGKDFIITLAPVATALQGKRHLSGFNYEELEKAFGRHIDWYNTQFYCGWGSAHDTSGYDEIIRRGWPAEKVVLGLITTPEGTQGWIPDDFLWGTLTALKNKYPKFGGVMGWEYWCSVTTAEPQGWPCSWANLMTKVVQPEHRIEEDANPMTQQNEKSTSDSTGPP